jgi:hypothetical protein
MRRNKMRYLDQLKRKCHHSPKMGGNREAITLPCSVVSRLIALAEAWESVPPELDRLPVAQEMQGLLVETEDAVAFLMSPPNAADQRTPAGENHEAR